MDFIFSSFLWLLPLSLTPLIFHLINNRKFKVVQFSSIKLIDYLKTKSIRKMNIVNILLLLIRMLIILFIILAISRPILKASASFDSDPSSLSLVVVIDDTFSNMNTSNRDKREEEIVDLIKVITSHYDEKVYFEVVSATKNLIYSGVLEDFKIEELPIEFSYKTGSLLNVIPRYFTNKYTDGFTNGNMFIISDMNKDFFDSDIYDDWWDIVVINSSSLESVPVISSVDIADEIILPSKPFEVSLSISSPSYTDEKEMYKAYVYVDDLPHLLDSLDLSSNLDTVISFNSVVERRGEFNIEAYLLKQETPISLKGSQFLSNRYFLRESVLPRAEVCFCEISDKVSRYIEAAIYSINDEGIFLIRNCSYYYEDLLGNEVVFIDNLELLEQEGFQKYLNDGGHVISFPSSVSFNPDLSESVDLIYVLKENITDKRILNSVFKDVRGDTLFQSVDRYLKPIKNESIIIANQGSLWDREYIGNGLLDVFSVPLNVSESDFALKAPFVPFIHYLILSHNYRKFDQLSLGEDMIEIKHNDINSDQITLSNTEEELNSFKSIGEISLKGINSPGNYFIASSRDTIKQFSVNVSSQELHSEKIDLNTLSDQYANLSIINDLLNLKDDLAKKLKDFEIWHIFLSLSILFLIIEMVLVNVFYRK